MGAGKYGLSASFIGSGLGGGIPVGLVKVERMTDIGDMEAAALTKANGEKSGLSHALVLRAGSALLGVLAALPLDLTVAA
jgi:hypothetical protein